MAALSFERMSYTDRIPYIENSTGQLICEIADEKKTNLCVAADASLALAMEVLETCSGKILMLKTQVKMWDDFTLEGAQRLQELAEENRVVLFEDSKFNDIGESAKNHYTRGVFKVASWAQLTNCMTVSGPDILKGLHEGMIETAKKVPKAANNAVLVLGEMSSKDNLFPLFNQKSYEHAVQYKKIVPGFIGQGTYGPNFLTIMPGVNSAVEGDSLGQQYNTPKKAIEKGADVIIVGRGITGFRGQEMVNAAEAYRTAAWSAHEDCLAAHHVYKLRF